MASKRQQRADTRAKEQTAGGLHQAVPATSADQTHPREYDARTHQALQALTDTALSHLSITALLPEMLERVRAVMQVDNVAILLVDQAAQVLDVSAASGPEEDLVGRVRIPVGEGFAGEIAASGQSLAVADTSAFPVVNPVLRHRLRSVLGVPLLAGGRVLGVLHVGMTNPHEFNADDQALLQQAADRLALAVERAQLFEAVEVARQAVQRQASLINLSFEPIFAWSVEGGIVEWNAGAEQLYGYTRAEALGRVSHDLLHTVHPMPLDAFLAALGRDGQWTGELRHTTKGGREVVVESRQQIIEVGGQRLVVETNRDVTERRRLEREAEAATRQATEGAERTRKALEAFIAITQALVTAPSDDAAAISEGVEESASQHADASLGRQPGEIPLAHRLAELTRGILGCRLVAVSAVEEVDGQLFDRPAAVVGMSPEMERRWWAEQAALPPHLVGTGMLPDDRERLIAGEVFTADLTRPPYEVPNDYGVTALLGVAMYVQGRMVGLLALDFDDPGRQPHVFTPEEIQIAAGVARLGAMVLERDRLLREREAARAEALALAEANRRMDEFLGIAGHELRTPVTTVKANLQMAERRARQALQPDRDQSKQQTALTQLMQLLAGATQAADRQQRLVEDLLNVSRVSAGQLEYRMALHDLAALVRETVAEQRLHDPARRIELAVPDAHVPVIADADRLGQVLTNYLTNAIKYSAGDRPVFVTLRRQESAQGSSVRVEVRDQGPGLSPEQQRHLFERFYRVPGVTVMSGSGVGLGLGLYICRTVVEQHGGAVGVESEPGAGSTFWFTLPLAPADPADRAQSDAGAPRPRHGG